MFKRLAASVTNCTNILSVRIQDSHVSGSATAVVEVVNTTLEIGDSISIDVGYAGDTGTVFTGYVKMIERKAPDNTYIITSQDVMVRAMDYYMASSNPEAPFSRSNIAAEDLVQDLMAEAGLTNYTADPTSFTFGVVSPVEVNLISAYDFAKQIGDILAWHLWADKNGQVHFEDRKPYVTGSDTSVATITTKTRLSYVKSEKDLRNRVVVYGTLGVYAEASASSPYLPSGFYKSTVLATEIIQDNSIAQSAADYNLDLFNRLTQQCSVGIPGDHFFTARQIVTLNDTFTGASGDWYVFGVEHVLSQEGYITNLDLRQ